MKKIVLIIIALLFLAPYSYSQKKGYIGKIHQVQFDVGRILWGYYHAEYKISVWKHFGFAATGGLIRKDAELPIDQNVVIPTAKYVEIEGKSLGVGMVYNSYVAGISMPVGFYSGVYYVRSQGTVYEFKENYKVSAYSEFKSNLIKVYYGKNIVLYKFMTLDLGLSSGLQWGNITSYGSSEFEILPATLFFENYSSFYYRPYSTSGRKLFVKYYLMPEFKVGYMF